MQSDGYARCASPTTPYMGTQGTSGLKIYEHNIASTGLTEGAAKDEGLKVETVTITDHYRPEFMPTFEEVTLKVVYEQDSRRMLGAGHFKVDMTQSAVGMHTESDDD